jgi:membrane-bound lytic murein transglycosylase D
MNRPACLTLIIAGLSACAHPSPRMTAARPRAAADSVRTAASPPAHVADSVVTRAPARAVRDSVDSLPRSIDQMLKSLGDSSLVPAVVLAAAPAPEITWDIDVRSYLTQDRVEYYVRRFSGDARARIGAWLQRGHRYEPMIRSTFRGAGIPEDMYYLGLVESGYDPHAYSRAAAVGMWQFMASTARGMGLRVDWWIDERRDPVRSTRAAARFLSALRDQFGSMYLAAAAYNGGPGRVARGLTRYAAALETAAGEDRFFVLADRRALRMETSNYVPQLIAAALVGKTPGRYGMSLDSVAPFAYDSVQVPPATPLAVVARASGVSVEAVRDLNPHILRGVTPLTDPYRVRVPVGTAARFDSAFSLIADSDRVAFHRVSVKKGATIASVASKAGLSQTQLLWYNPKLPRTKSGKLSPGQQVVIPAVQVVAAAFDVPDPAVERWGGGAGSNGVHIVRRGESLSGLAARYHTSVAALIRLNKLKKPVIYAGQAIIVRGRAPAKATKATKATRSTKATSPVSGTAAAVKPNHR